MPVRTTDFEQFDYKTGKRSRLALSVSRNENYTEFRGTFMKPRGMVLVWTMQSNIRPAAWTLLETVQCGRTYTRRWQRAWPRKTLTQLCGRFLDDLHRPASPDRVPL